MATDVERKAHNEAVFREANERIEAARAQVGLDEGTTPFICECEDEGCRTIVLLTSAEYAAVRSDPHRFLIARGHPTSCAEVVAEHDEYVVVDKYGRAGEIAEETAPRVHDG